MIHTWTTPGGRTAAMEVRPDTNDWNVMQSCLAEDEYRVSELPPIEGWALDIGAHIGGATVALALAHPNASVLAVEPLPANARLLRRNVAMNGLAGRVAVVEAAVGAAEVRHGFTGSEAAEHYQFIGNLTLQRDGAPERIECDGFETLACRKLRPADLLAAARVDRFDFVKIDCEGGEWEVAPELHTLSHRAAGEWHWTGGDRADFERALGPGWALEFYGFDDHGFFGTYE